MSEPFKGLPDLKWYESVDATSKLGALVNAAEAMLAAFCVADDGSEDYRLEAGFRVAVRRLRHALRPFR